MRVQRAIGAYIRHPRSQPFQTTFMWDSDDPLAIRLDFPQGEERIYWVIGRDMLHRGTFFNYSGETHGDVSVWPEGDRVVISLRPSNNGRADVVCSRAGVKDFLNATLSITPLGQEGPRIEAAIQNFIDDIRRRNA